MNFPKNIMRAKTFTDPENFFLILLIMDKIYLESPLPLTIDSGPTYRQGRYPDSTRVPE